MSKALLAPEEVVALLGHGPYARWSDDPQGWVPTTHVERAIAYISVQAESLAEAKVRAEALEAGNARLRNALNAVKLRMIFVGWPAEPMWEPNGIPIPDWRKEYAIINAALSPAPPPNERREAMEAVCKAVSEELPCTILGEDEAHWFPRTRCALNALAALDLAAGYRANAEQARVTCTEMDVLDKEAPRTIGAYCETHEPGVCDGTGPACVIREARDAE